MDRTIIFAVQITSRVSSLYCFGYQTPFLFSQEIRDTSKRNIWEFFLNLEFLKIKSKAYKCLKHGQILLLIIAGTAEHTIHNPPIVKYWSYSYQCADGITRNTHSRNNYKVCWKLSAGWSIPKSFRFRSHANAPGAVNLADVFRLKLTSSYRPYLTTFAQDIGTFIIDKLASVESYTKCHLSGRLTQEMLQNL